MKKVSGWGARLVSDGIIDNAKSYLLRIFEKFKKMIWIGFVHQSVKKFIKIKNNDLNLFKNIPSDFDNFIHPFLMVWDNEVYNKKFI